MVLNFKKVNLKRKTLMIFNALSIMLPCLFVAWLIWSVINVNTYNTSNPELISQYNAFSFFTTNN